MRSDDGGMDAWDAGCGAVGGDCGCGAAREVVSAGAMSVRTLCGNVGRRRERMELPEEEASGRGCEPELEFEAEERPERAADGVPVAEAVRESAAVDGAPVAEGTGADTGCESIGERMREERRTLYVRGSASAMTTSRAPRSHRGQGTNVLWRYERVAHRGWDGAAERVEGRLRGDCSVPFASNPGKGGTLRSGDGGVAWRDV